MSGKFGKAMLICGKICSGKTTYCERLSKEQNAAVLSCDELVLQLFGERLGDRHEEITGKAQRYLLAQAAKLLELGVNIILEWGFWSHESRRNAEKFFKSRGFETEWYYIEVSDEEWRRRIEKRNREADGQAYFVDDAIAEKCNALFEPPLPEEIDIRI